MNHGLRIVSVNLLDSRRGNLNFFFFLLGGTRRLTVHRTVEQFAFEMNRSFTNHSSYRFRPQELGISL